jgi:hypothetical protein
MTFAITLAIAVFLSGAAIAVFVIIVAGIRASDRHYRLTAAPDTQLDALTRRMLGVGVRPLGRRTDRDQD